MMMREEEALPAIIMMEGSAMPSSCAHTMVDAREDVFCNTLDSL